MDKPGKVANPTRGQLNTETFFPLSPFAPENLVLREREEGKVANSVRGQPNQEE